MEKPAMWLDATWMQRGLSALRNTLDADSKDQMIQFLFDTGLWDPEILTGDAAIARFNSGLNPAKVTVNFKLCEIWALMRHFDRHELFHVMADDLGYEIRKKSSNERVIESNERLARAIENSNRLLAEAAGDKARLTAPQTVSRIHPAIQDGRGSFSMEGKGF
jgi:hypothetical protein